LPAIGTAYASEPRDAWTVLLHPPVELTGMRPGSHIHLDRRINCTAVYLAELARIEIHI
jgi:hypothetical protein